MFANCSTTQIYKTLAVPLPITGTALGRWGRPWSVCPLSRKFFISRPIYRSRLELQMFFRLYSSAQLMPSALLAVCAKAKGIVLPDGGIWYIATVWIDAFQGMQKLSFYQCLDLICRPLQSNADSCSTANAVTLRAVGFGAAPLKNKCSIADPVTAADRRWLELPMPGSACNESCVIQWTTPEHQARTYFIADMCAGRSQICPACDPLLNSTRQRRLREFESLRHSC